MILVRIAQLAGGFALVALLVWRVDVDELPKMVRSSNWLLLTCATMLNIPVMGLLGFRSNLVLRALGHNIPRQVVYPSAVLGNVLGSLTPIASGELVRVGTLRSKADISLDEGMALILFERGWSVLLLSLGAGVGIAGLRLSEVGTIAASGGAAMLAVALYLAVKALVAILSPAILEPRHRFTRPRRVAAHLRDIMRADGLLLAWAGATTFAFAFIALQYWLIASAVNARVSVLHIWTAFAASQLAGIVSLLPLGLGSSDGSLAAVLSMAGLRLQEGTAVALLVRLAITLPLGIAGLASYVYLVGCVPSSRHDPEK